MFICLDPGHAGQSTDPGAVSPYGIRESDINLSVAHICSIELKKLGHSVLMTRTKPEEANTDDLAYRCQLANNARCDCFVSIHCNSAASSTANGWEIFHHPESINAFRLALSVGKEFRALPLRERGVKNCNFYVLKHTVMPAILIECAFLSNLKDESFIADARNHLSIANAIIKGILNNEGGAKQ